MPIYEEEGRITREDLLDLSKRNMCKECGGRLNVFWDMDAHKAYLACNNDQSHEGIEREASRYEMEGLASLNINTRREIMNQQFGEQKTKALDRYIDTVAITKRIATDIVETLWGDAPIIEKSKCILLCQTYQLNPLMKHIYLIGYKRYKDRKLVVDDKGNPVLDWSIQIGIGATRLMAQRKHNYSYLDMTPRKATKTEIEKILGDTADPECIYGFVHIKDVDTGAEAFGLRGIGRNENIKGVEKGNTHLNMACVRAERLALDRQYPGEMPQGVEVIDERYIEGEYKVVNETTGEITEPSPEPETEPKEHWCQEHNCAFDKKTRGTSTWYAHPLPGGGWCNEKKKAEASKEETSQSEPELSTTSEAPPPDEPINMDWLKESLKKVKFDEKTAATWITSHFGVEGGLLKDVLARLTKEQQEEFVKEIEDRLEMA